ncbi:MAG: signal peptidase I [Ruminococcaceae bacterium]|nr:signal peptidase I [Oscillospiraceae bacterium]
MKISFKSVIRISVLVLLAVLVGISIYSMNARMLGGNALPMPFGFGMTVVLSGSMEPELSVDDLLIVTPADTYEVGDVVVFQTQRTAVVHRIVAINGDEIITRGDANSSDDDPITLQNIKGRVVCAIPFVGLIVNLIKTPVGTVILLGLAFWLLEASFKKEKAQKQTELDAIRREIEELKKANEQPTQQPEQEPKEEPKEEPNQEPKQN